MRVLLFQTPLELSVRGTDEALRGRITEHRRTMLRLHLQVVGALQRTLAELDAAVGKALAPIRQRARLLTTMPGSLT